MTAVADFTTLLKGRKKPEGSVSPSGKYVKRQGKWVPNKRVVKEANERFAEALRRDNEQMRKDPDTGPQQKAWMGLNDALEARKRLIQMQTKAYKHGGRGVSTRRLVEAEENVHRAVKRAREQGISEEMINFAKDLIS